MDARCWLSWWERLKCESVQCQQETHTSFSMLIRNAVVHTQCMQHADRHYECSSIKILIKTKTKKYAHPSALGMVGCKRMCFIILSLSRLLPINSFNGSFELWPAQSWFHRSVNLHYCISNNSLAWLGWDDSSPQPASITVRKKDLEPSQTRPQHPSHTWRETHLASQAQFHMQTKQ